MKESVFQKKVIDDLKKRFPGCMVLKNDPNYITGIPDLLVMHKDRWAALECKESEKAYHTSRSRQPIQGHYISKMNEMSYAAFIYPENKEEVFNELQQTFER